MLNALVCLMVIQQNVNISITASTATAGGQLHRPYMVLAIARQQVSHRACRLACSHATLL